MGERVTVGFKLSGPVKRSDLPELFKVLGEYDFRGDDWVKVSEDNLTNYLTAEEVNYGNIDTLEEFCAGKDIDYEMWCESGSWGAGTIARYRGGVSDSFISAENGSTPCIPLEELVRADALATGWAVLHQRIRWFLEPMPEMVIVDG